jgi:antitoxin YefM
VELPSDFGGFGFRVSGRMMSGTVWYDSGIWTRSSGRQSATGRRTTTLRVRHMLVILVTMPETRSLADVKAHLSELVAQVGAQHDRVTVTVYGKPTAVLVAVDDLDALEETIAVLSDNDVLHALADADDELASGLGESEAELRTAMSARRHRSD